MTASVMERVEGIAGDLILPASEYQRSRMPWLEARRSGLGASDTAAILGLSTWTTPFGVWLSKVNPITEDAYPSEAAEWGSALEAVVARKVSTRHPELGKIAPTPGIIAHREHRWMLATLDRLLVPRRRRTGVPETCLEIKTVGDFVYREKWVDDEPPVYIQIQCQQQLAVTGFAYLWLAALVGGQRMGPPIRIERDEATIDRLIEYGGLWWSDHVVAGVKPDLTYADRDVIDTYFPGDAGLPAITADEWLERHLALYLDARRRAKEAEEEKDQLGYAIKRRMGDHQAVKNCSGDVLATWKPTSSKRVDVVALRAAEPDTAARFTKETTGRRFLPKEIDT